MTGRSGGHEPTMPDTEPHASQASRQARRGELASGRNSLRVVHPTCTSERARAVMERDERTQVGNTPGRERSEFAQVNQRFR